jgi:hypothetical protein
MAKKKSKRQSWVLPKTTLSQLLRNVRDIEKQISLLRLEIQAAGMLPKSCDCPGTEIAPRQTTTHLPGCHNGNKANTVLRSAGETDPTARGILRNSLASTSAGDPK